MVNTQEGRNLISSWGKVMQLSVPAVPRFQPCSCRAALSLAEAAPDQRLCRAKQVWFSLTSGFLISVGRLQSSLTSSLLSQELKVAVPREAVRPFPDGLVVFWSYRRAEQTTLCSAGVPVWEWGFVHGSGKGLESLQRCSCDG